MASRGTLKTQLLQLLGTSSDDPAYTTAVLDNALQMATDSLVSEIVERNPQFFSTTVTLSAVSATSHTYNLASQAATFAKWLELRDTDSTGARFTEVRAEELDEVGSLYFAITGPDQTTVIETSADTDAGLSLFLRYVYWPAAYTSDNDVSELPSRFHDVIALEAMFYVFGQGAEQRMSPELIRMHQDRKALLMAHCTRRGVLSPGVRIDRDE